jgi:hypothetical protein
LRHCSRPAPSSGGPAHFRLSHIAAAGRGVRWSGQTGGPRRVGRCQSGRAAAGWPGCGSCSRSADRVKALVSGTLGPAAEVTTGAWPWRPARTDQPDLRRRRRSQTGQRSRPERRLGARLFGALRTVGNPDHGGADGGAAVFLCIASARRELPLLPHTALWLDRVRRCGGCTQPDGHAAWELGLSTISGLVVSSSGSGMGAAIHRQLRSDAVRRRHRGRVKRSDVQQPLQAAALLA